MESRPRRLGAATWKLRRLSCVLVEGTNIIVAEDLSDRNASEIYAKSIGQRQQKPFHFLHVSRL